VGWKQGTSLGTEEGSMLEVECWQYVAEDSGVSFVFGGHHCDKPFIKIWRAEFGREFSSYCWGRLHKKHGVQRGFLGANSEFSLGTEENHGNH
jgi:hypothetical protein